KGKQLWTDGDKGELIKSVKLQNQLDEARYISDTVAALHEDGEDFRNFAVLYRTNAMSRAVEQALAKSGIPYRMLGSLRFFDRAEIKDILAYLCVINNPGDSVRLRRIINMPKRGIGDKSISVAQELADIEGTSLLDIMRRANSFKAIPAAASASMIALAELIDKLRSQASEMKISALIEAISVKVGYQAMLVAAGEAEKDRLENIGELVSTAAQYEENSENPTISEFLEDVALVTDIDRYDDTADAVVLMTIHAAKGLEFKNVFLPGWEEGIFPGFQSIMNPEEIEEERRLAYVAMTRAEKRLYITHVHQRMLNGSTLYNQESRFLREVPEWLCEEKDATLSSYGASDAYSYGKRMPARAGSTPIYNHSAPGSGWGTGEERAAYTGNVPKSPRQSSLPKIAGIGGSSPTPKKAPVESFDKGDRVRHTTFGVGVMTDVKPMGGDVLYHIEFDKVGTKKLMASFARLKKE
ncbi:MAG: ATP-binding domain-containing protein, partial [Clostridia bacterium]|nr:ATP-binding domain-containing protein [Clostridia bacterium]